MDKNKAVVCCLLATSAIMLSENKTRKLKMCSKKWHLKRNISCDAHLLNGLLETDVPRYDTIVVSAGKMKKLWDSLSELRSSVCERRLERTVLRRALFPVKTAQFTHFFRQFRRHTVKSLSLTENVYGALFMLAILKKLILGNSKPADLICEISPKSDNLNSEVLWTYYVLNSFQTREEIQKILLRFNLTHPHKTPNYSVQLRVNCLYLILSAGRENCRKYGRTSFML